MEVKKHFDLLGHKAKDRVTGFSGVVDSICFDLYGCVQASIRPPQNEKGGMPDGMWFDILRLNITTKNPVMDAPNFMFGPVAEGKHGPADKACRRDKRV